MHQNLSVNRLLRLTKVEDMVVSPDLASNWFPKPCMSALGDGPRPCGLIGCHALGCTWPCIGSPRFGVGLQRVSSRIKHNQENKDENFSVDQLRRRVIRGIDFRKEKKGKKRTHKEGKYLTPGGWNRGPNPGPPNAGPLLEKKNKINITHSNSCWYYIFIWDTWLLPFGGKKFEFAPCLIRC